MESSIIFLGTGGDTFIIGKQVRASGGIVIKVDDNQFHIDPGPGAIAMAKQYGINIRENTAVLVSNNSLYRSNDVNAIIDGMTYAGFDKKGVLISNKTTIHGSEKKRAQLLDFYKDSIERFIVLEAGRKVGINNVEIMALKTKQKDENAVGFKFFTPYFTLSYPSDTNYASSIVEQYRDSDILILNVPYVTKKETQEGLCKEDSIRIIKAVEPKLAIITGFGADMIKSDPMYEIRDIQKETKAQVIAAKDGMTIAPGSYSVSQRQKSLKSFSEEKKAEVKEEQRILDSD